MTLMEGAIASHDRGQRWTVDGHASRRGRLFRARTGMPADRAVLARATAETRAALQEAVTAATAAAEHARSMAAMLEETLAVLSAEETTAAPALASETVLGKKPSGRASGLSPREWEVLALVAEGRSNKAIAAELFVSPNTVKTHVASLLSKLQAETRVQLAAMAARHGVQ